MRVAFAILFSLLVGFGQTAFPSGSAMPAKRVCFSCVCPAGHSCCYDPAGRNAPSAPLAPVQQASSEQLQLIIHQPALALTFSPNLGPDPVVAFAFIPSATAVPLYHRNCSLLI